MQWFQFGRGKTLSFGSAESMHASRVYISRASDGRWRVTLRSDPPEIEYVNTLEVAKSVGESLYLSA